MRSSVFASTRWISGLLVCILYGCPAAEPYPVEIAIDAPSGADLTGITVRFNGGDPYLVTDGRLGVGIKGIAGSELTVELALPGHLAVAPGSSATKTFTLPERTGSTPPAALVFKLPVRVKARAGEAEYLLQILEGCPGQQVEVDGVVRGAVDGERGFSATLVKKRGAPVFVVLPGSETCPAARCEVELGADGTVDLDEACRASEAPDAGVEEPESPPDAGDPLAARSLRIPRSTPVRPSEPRREIVPPPIPPEPVRPRVEPKEKGIEEPRPAKGAVPLEVRCSPTGLELVVDDRVMLAICEARQTVHLTPGSHVFRMHARAGSQSCPGAEPVVHVVPKRGPAPPLVLDVDCKGKTCAERAKDLVKSKKTVGETDLGCLAAIKEDATSYVESQVLLAHVLETQKKENAKAEDVLRRVLQTNKGREDAEVHYRLALLLQKRKEWNEQKKHADQAWTYKRQFASMENGASRMLGVLWLRARALEGLFYSQGDRKMFDRAVDEYKRLEGEAAKGGEGSDSDKWLGEARSGLARMKEQDEHAKITAGEEGE